MNRNETTGTSPRPKVISEEPRGENYCPRFSPRVSLGWEFTLNQNRLARFSTDGVGVPPLYNRSRRCWRLVASFAVSHSVCAVANFRDCCSSRQSSYFKIITLNTGTLFTTASRSTIFINVYPFFTAIFAHLWIPAERLSVTKTLGIIVAFSGVFVTVAPNLSDGETSILGDLLVLISGCFLGLRVVVTKLLVQSIHPYRLLVWYLSLSLPCYAVLSFVFERGEPMHLTFSSTAALLYQGGVIAGFCFLAWTSILERYSASKLVVLFFATPLVWCSG